MRSWGKSYAIGDRCGHENARLARDKREGTLVICPIHSSKFDVKKWPDPFSSWPGLPRNAAGVPNT